MSTLIRQFFMDETGATAVEYGLLASLLGAAIITSLELFSSGLNEIFTLVSNNLMGTDNQES